MPSAANVKIDKQISSENALPDSSNASPLRQAITVIEHKIRNLEKRKTRLESYRALQSSGKDLNADQKTAVAKYDEVIQTLEFAKDLCKQFLSIAAVSEKEAKKQARKEAAARSQSELAKIRDVLLVQDALTQMGQDNIREDFLLGRNGAATLTQNDLDLLDELYPAVTPKHEAGDPTAFTNQVQSAAEHLLAVVDGKQKEAFGGTYSQIKEVIGKIHESGYLDQAVEAVGVTYEETTEVTEVEAVQPVAEVLEEDVLVAEVPVAQPLEGISMAPAEHPVEQPPLPDQMYYQQPPRPISEMLGTGSFYFLQDSELDTPPEQIPSQTFTNQSFVTAPPPPIPMPPHHFHGFPTGGVQVAGNNGLDGGAPEKPDDVQKQRPRAARPLPNNQQQQQQQFYQNNGMNRPVQNRRGPQRPAAPTNRHQ